MVVQSENGPHAKPDLSNVGAGTHNPVLRQSALETLEETSRTFFTSFHIFSIPI